jgi:hypothetical protein
MTAGFQVIQFQNGERGAWSSDKKPEVQVTHIDPNLKTIQK